MINSKFLLYKTSDNKISINVQIQDETVWLTQEQMADLFDRSRLVFIEYLRNVFNGIRLIGGSVARENQTTNRIAVYKIRDFRILWR